jgi:hypothetical protein
VAESHSLEELVELVTQGTLEVWVEAIEGVLLQVGHLIPWVQDRLVLIGAWESQLDADAAVLRPLALATLCSNGASLFSKANKVWLPWASVTAIPLPVQVLKSAFVELKNLQKFHQVEVKVENL